MENEDKEMDITEDLISDNNPFAKEVLDSSESQETAENDEADTKITDEISSLKAELDKVNNQYIRLAADFDNYRKRQMQEREALLKYGAEETLKKMIEALDNIDRAKASVENVEDVNTVKDSYNLVFKQIYDVLQKIGLEVIDTKDKEFDPNMHEAVMQTPTSDYPENTIIAELQTGYMLNDRILREAMVVVTKGGKPA